MVKLSTPLVFTPDPSSLLISIKYGSHKRTMLTDPDWFASAMLKLFRPADTLAQRFPLPHKVQKAVLKYDVSNTIDDPQF